MCRSPSWTPADKRAALLRLTRLEAQLAALKLRVMAVADDVAWPRVLVTWRRWSPTTPVATAVRTVATWHSPLRLTGAGGRWAGRSGQGEVNLAQARVITHALEELPTEKVSADDLTRAEDYLVEQAAHFGPRELRVLGRRVLEMVAPEIAEQHEAEQLAEEERRAWRSTSLVSMRRGDGTTRFTINVPDTVATRLHTYLEAFTSPRHQGLQGVAEGDRITVETQARPGVLCADGGHRPRTTAGPRRRRHHAHRDCLHRAAAKELGTAELGPADKLTAGEVRRLACTAKIIPAVLGGKSEVLDLGRSSRLFKPAQRKAMIIRDRECRAEGCTIPAAWCEAHHWGRPWAKGGRTDLEGRRTALHLAPPPRARPAVRQQPDAKWGRAVQQAKVRGKASQRSKT